MHHFTYKNNTLHCENVPVQDVADQVGTPFYLYSSATLKRHFQAFESGFDGMDHLTCFAVKACSNIAILNIFGQMGGGADIVSGGELFRAMKAGIDSQKIIYSGVGKTRAEMREALYAGILMFNVESPQELDRLQEVAAGFLHWHGVEVNLSCPNVAEGGHDFGRDPETVASCVAIARAQLPDRALLVKLTPNVADIASLATAAGQAGADGAGQHLQPEDGGADDQHHHDFFRDIPSGTVGGLRQHQPQTGCSGDQADQQHAGHEAKTGDGVGDVGGYIRGADVVQAKPAGKRQRHQEQQPDEAGVLDPGLTAGRDFSDQRARGVLQHHGVAAHCAKQAKGHRQGYQDLHGGHTKVTQSGIQAQRQSLLLLGVEETDIGHGRGEITTTKTRQQGQTLEYPQRRILVAEGDTCPQGGYHQQRRGEKQRIAPAIQADKEAAGDTQCCTGQAGNGHQGKQLGFRKRKP